MIRVSEQLDLKRVQFSVAGVEGVDTLWYEWGGEATPEASTHLDAAMVALTPVAMRSGAELFVDGAVDTHLLASVQEWADAWACIRPDLFSQIQIDAKDSYTPPALSKRRSAIVAFSGGVDSLYAASEHLAKTADADPSLVLVHGFDLPLEDQAGFETAFHSAQTAAEVLGRPLAWVRTNWRRDLSQNWTMEFAAGLTSALQLWRFDASQAVLGSDEGSGYGFEVYPWGSNPATNHLLGSPAFPIVTHGFAADRVEKCRVVAERAELLKVVRVCLVREAAGRNCGVCEKCLRTKLCLAATGVREMAAFDDHTLDGLQKVRLHKPHLRTTSKRCWPTSRVRFVLPSDKPSSTSSPENDSGYILRYPEGLSGRRGIERSVRSLVFAELQRSALRRILA